MFSPFSHFLQLHATAPPCPHALLRDCACRMLIFAIRYDSRVQDRQTRKSISDAVSFEKYPKPRPHHRPRQPTPLPAFSLPLPPKTPRLIFRRPPPPHTHLRARAAISDSQVWAPADVSDERRQRQRDGKDPDSSNPPN